MRSNRNVRPIDLANLKTGVADAGIKPLVKIGKIGKSKLASQAEVEQARQGVGELAPDLVKHYQDVATVLGDPDRIAWDIGGLAAEFAGITEAILGTGSTEKNATPTARRAREVVVLAAGQAMTAFPKTVIALVYLANHAIEIGLLRQPIFDQEKGLEKGFCVDMPIGDPVRPEWTELLCPLPKSAELVAKFIAMSTEARQTAQNEQRDKIMGLQLQTGTFLKVFEGGEGETACYVPAHGRSSAMYLKLTIDNGYITVKDAAGNPLGQTLIGFWIPLESVEKNCFAYKVREPLEENVIKIMTTIRYCIRAAWLYACRLREDQQAKQADLAPTESATVEPLSTAATEE